MTLALVLLVVAGCDNTFEPIAESDRALSIFGHLDPSADTQCIRVMPTRPSIFTSPEPQGVKVTLEELGTGRLLQVRDSTFEYPHNVHVGSGGVFVQNYWTTDRIVPGEVYRFTATGPNGIPSGRRRYPSPCSVSLWLRPGAFWRGEAATRRSLRFLTPN